MGRTTSPSGTGVYGVGGEGAGKGVTGVNATTGNSGFLAGIDPVFHQQAGVYGFSRNQGVIGVADGGLRVADGGGTGVYGTGHFGVRGESRDEGTGVYGTGGKWAGRFDGN